MVDVCHSPSIQFSNLSQTSSEEGQQFCLDLPSFSHYCIQLVSLHYSVNEIILSQVFVPMDRVPFSSISIQNLQTSLNAANNITQIMETMTLQKNECHIPLVCFLFANIIYRKLLSYAPGEIYAETGKVGLIRSVEIAKASITYMYDFEMSRSLVHLMEQDVQYALYQRTNNNFSPTPSVISSDFVSVRSS